MNIQPYGEREYYQLPDGTLYWIEPSRPSTSTPATNSYYGSSPPQNYKDTGYYSQQPIAFGNNVGQSGQVPSTNLTSWPNIPTEGYPSDSNYAANLTSVNSTSIDNFRFVAGHVLLEDTGFRMRCSCGAEYNAAKPKHNKSNFKRHLASQVVSFRCDLCPREFNRDDNLRNHRRVVHRTAD